MKTDVIYLATSHFTGVFGNLALILEFISKTDWCIMKSGRLAEKEISYAVLKWSMNFQVYSLIAAGRRMQQVLYEERSQFRN